MFSPCALCGEDVAPGRGALGHGGYVHGDPSECPVQTEWAKKHRGVEIKSDDEDEDVKGVDLKIDDEGEVTVSLGLKPMPSLPEGDPELPAPSDAELDDLFREIDEAILGHPYFMAVRMGLQGLNNYTERHHALLDVLVKSGVLPDTAHVAFEAALAARVAESDLETFREFMTAAAKGLIRVSGSALPPDDVSTLFSSLFGSDPHPGEAIRIVVTRGFDAKRVAHFHHHLREDQESSLLDRLFSYVKKERARAKEAAEGADEKEEDADFGAALEEARKRAEEAAQRRAERRADRREHAERKIASLKRPRTLQERVDALAAESSGMVAAVIALKRELAAPGATPGEHLATSLKALEVSHELLGKDIEELRAKIKPATGDAPFCQCKSVMIRAANQYYCPSCGLTKSASL